MQLLVKEDHRAPVVVSQVWYKVGSSYEHGGITGISHVLEHMMFKGTKKYPGGQFSKIIAENGGDENAATYYDYTMYYQVLDAKKLPLSFELESDRMRNLLFKEDDFKKEIQVVMEERRMRVDDSPQALTYERLMAAAHVSNPYHHMVIGWMSDLKNMTIADVRDWYQRWYAPNNAIVVVVGDVKSGEVYELAKKYFGTLKPSVLPEIKPRKEVRSIGLRQLEVRTPAQLPWLAMAYNVPVVKTAKNEMDAYTLWVISGLLSGGDSARIPKNLIRGQSVASDASAAYDPFSRLENTFLIEGTPAQGRSIEQLKQALLTQVKQLQDVPVAMDELNRVKTQVIAGKVYQKDSLAAQAEELGTLSVVGLPWQLSDEYIKKIEAVTPEMIQQVARRYLTSDRLTIANLTPLPLQKPITSAPSMPLRDQHVR